MAAVSSAQTLPLSSVSPQSVSPSRKRLSKVLNAGSRRSSDAQSESGTAGIRASLETLGLSRSSTTKSQRSLSREGSTRSSTSGSVKKLLPGHAKRERRRVREDEMQKIQAEEEATRGRQPAADHVYDISPSRPDDLSRSHSSLLTVDSEIDSRPSLVDRDSHTGYLTTTSPLITTTQVDHDAPDNDRNRSTETFPVIIDPPQLISAPTSPKSTALHNVPPLPALPGLVDKADTLRPMVDPSRVRGKSPARRFKDVFHIGGKSPRVSPERKQSTISTASPKTSPNSDPVKPGYISQSFSERRLSNNPEAHGPSPLRSQTLTPAMVDPPRSPELPRQSPVVPHTPPQSILRQPTTTITPPTPTESETRSSVSSGQPDYAGNGWGPEHSTLQNTTHRRTRSQPGSLHQKSKLSTSIIPPLTPTIEEVQTPDSSTATPGSRNVSATGGGFFSSWVSAAQNAATSISSLTNQNRARSGTSGSEMNKTKAPETASQQEPATSESIADLPKKEQAVDTLGAGDLNLSHLGIEASERRAVSPSRSEFAPSIKDDAAARMEDILAKKAVSQAYGKPTRSGEATPIAEIPDPVQNIRPASTFESNAGTLTPPNGSIYEGEASGVNRSNSVRSKLNHRRSRGSSVTTAQSAIGAMIGASTATLANPATGPKLSGFAVAPKQRNRAFHQQFRSVPEDDFLIEDYSCALQKEILLAGRIYISEGHICFSSNILGWVTTLIISFEEVVSIEKENTAIVIPNAIAVQTLHARHTFRSLLSREATYDLMIGIWRVSHPDSFQKSMNGQKLAAGVSSTENVDKDGEGQEGQDSADDISDSDASDDDDDDDGSVGTAGSVIEQGVAESKTISRKPSGGMSNGPGPTMAAATAPASGDAIPAVVPVVSAPEGAQDFPGPATHAPTDCTDSATHFDKVIKDEVIPAPLGKIYTLLYGPQSGAFCRKFLVDGSSKAQDLQMEDDKKGLDNDNKTRKYQYIKPLGGSIGPKQTTCITTETLDFFDLEKSVSVSCLTQTPDVPSGSAFTVKTRYCLSWAPGNATRFQMNMTIDWTAKSWLKGPIEKGALDGQQQYGEDLVKTLKGALGRARAQTAGSKIMKNGKKKTKRSKRDRNEAVQSETKKEDNWGAFEILKPVLGPVVAPLKPYVSTNVVVTILAFMVLWLWVRGGSSSSALSHSARIERIAQYDQLWQKEENGLWDWLQERAGVDKIVIRDSLKSQTMQTATEKQKVKQRKKLLKSKDIQNRLAEEKKSMKEMEEAVRVTQDRLDALRRSLEVQRQSS